MLPLLRRINGSFGGNLLNEGERETGKANGKRLSATPLKANLIQRLNPR